MTKRDFEKVAEVLKEWRLEARFEQEYDDEFDILVGFFCRRMGDKFANFNWEKFRAAATPTEQEVQKPRDRLAFHIALWNEEA